mgnify:FL=1
MGMALAAWECRGKSADEQMEYLKKAAYTISHARPTTQKRMTLLCDICLKEAERALSAGENVAEAIKNKTIELNNVRYNRMAKIGSYLVDMFPDNGTVMTHCFAETIVGTMLRECRSRGKNIRLFCPSTNLTKADIVKRGVALGVDYHHTYSCYRGGEHHCGVCGTCTERHEALEQAGLDPAEFD